MLLILAGVTIATLTGENGILTNAKKAKNQTEIAGEREQVQLSATGALMNDLEGITEANLEEQLTINIGARDEKYTLQQITGGYLVTFTESGNEYIVYEDGRVIDYDGSFIVSSTPEEPSEEKSETFDGTTDGKSTNYGIIEVAFLSGTTHYITETANTPELGTGMKAVYWNEAGTEVTSDDANFDSDKWYSYTAQSGYTTTNGTSKWANAKTEDGSYWVWIPRYAYRIVYFNNAQNAENYRLGTLTEEEALSNEDIIGYSDARGIVDTAGNYMPNQSDISDTAIAVNEKRMRTHPAFESDVDKGGWDSPISGIWVAKYEMSQETSSDNGVNWNSSTTSSTTQGHKIVDNTTVRMVSKPGVSSWRYSYVGYMYENSLKCNEANNSHQIKNSEWGAVAYLTDSKYGRNGTSITENTNSSYTGGASGATAFTNPLQSSTGNETGVFDLSGGAREYTAVYNTAGTSTNFTTYGRSLVIANTTSTKYATLYTNTYSTFKDDFKLGKVSIIGDAIREIYTTENKGWYSCYSDCVSNHYAFLTRGGPWGVTGAGLFCSDSFYGTYTPGYSSFRVVLVVR